MVDPTSDLNEDVDEDEAPSCDNCGASIVSMPDGRVTTWIDDGTVRTARFCDEDCRENWDADRS